MELAMRRIFMRAARRRCESGVRIADPSIFSLVATNPATGLPDSRRSAADSIASTPKPAARKARRK